MTFDYSTLIRQAFGAAAFRVTNSLEAASKRLGIPKRTC
jgi:hypothetical protein